MRRRGTRDGPGCRAEKPHTGPLADPVQKAGGHTVYRAWLLYRVIRHFHLPTGDLFPPVHQPLVNREGTTPVWCAPLSSAPACSIVEDSNTTLSNQRREV